MYKNNHIDNYLKNNVFFNNKGTDISNCGLKMYTP